MSVSEFLNTLPIYDESNFSRFRTDSTNRTCVKRPPVYITTENTVSEQHIVTEETNILLRFLHQKRENSSQQKKRDQINDSIDEIIPRKRPRTRAHPSGL